MNCNQDETRLSNICTDLTDRQHLQATNGLSLGEHVDRVNQNVILNGTSRGRLRDVIEINRRKTNRANVKLLGILFILFTAFAIAEMVGAINGHSLSLLEDAATMLVDSMTYVANLMAERLKNQGIPLKTRRRFEFFVPFVSVFVLLGTSIYALVAAIQVIKKNEIPDESEKTEDGVMLVFSSINLVIDIICIAFFASADRLFGYGVFDADGDDVGNDSLYVLMTDYDESEIHQATLKRKDGNTNMCSAYTHVQADTLRSVAVLVVAIVSRTNKSLNPNVLDAWASVSITILIFLTTLPLLYNLKHKLCLIFMDAE